MKNIEKSKPLSIIALLTFVCITGEAKAGFDVRQLLEKVIAPQPAEPAQEAGPAPDASEPLSDTPYQEKEETYSRQNIDRPLPCFSEICLGANLLDSNYQSKKWTDLTSLLRNTLANKNNHQVLFIARSNVTSQIKNLPASEVENMTGYTAMERADMGLFKIVSKYKPVFCRAQTHDATFTSEAGYETIVTLMPTSPGALKIIGLERKFIYKTYDSATIKETKAALYKAYPEIDESISTKDVNWNGQLVRVYHDRTLDDGDIIMYKLNPDQPQAFNHSAQPGCSAKPLKLD